MADCSDVSDETNCGIVLVIACNISYDKHVLADSCESNQFTCGHSAVNHCVPWKLVCDGEDDCGDGSDESLDNCMYSYQTLTWCNLLIC